MFGIFKSKPKVQTPVSSVKIEVKDQKKARKYQCPNCGYGCDQCESVLCFACYNEVGYKCPKCGIAKS